MKLTITMIKNRLRSLFINTARIIASYALRPFKTCYLVFELERRTDICTTLRPAPHEYYYIDVHDKHHSEIHDEGPATIMVIED